MILRLAPDTEAINDEIIFKNVVSLVEKNLKILGL